MVGRVSSTKSSGAQVALICCLHHSLGALVLLQTCRKKQEYGLRPESHIHNSYSYSTGRNSVKWPPPNCRELGSVVYVAGRKQKSGEPPASLSFPLPVKGSCISYDCIWQHVAETELPWLNQIWALFLYNKESRGRQFRAAQGTRLLLLISLQSLNDFYSPGCKMALDNSVQSSGKRKGEDKVQRIKGLCLTCVVPFFKSFSGSPSSRLSLSWSCYLPGSLG